MIPIWNLHWICARVSWWASQFSAVPSEYSTWMDPTLSHRIAIICHSFWRQIPVAVADRTRRGRGRTQWIHQVRADVGSLHVSCQRAPASVEREPRQRLPMLVWQWLWATDGLLDWFLFKKNMDFQLDCGNWLTDSRFQGSVRVNSHAPILCQVTNCCARMGHKYHHDQSDIYGCGFHRFDISKFLVWPPFLTLKLQVWPLSHASCTSRYVGHKLAPAPNQPPCHCHFPSEESVDVGSLVFLGPCFLLFW